MTTIHKRPAATALACLTLGLSISSASTFAAETSDANPGDKSLSSGLSFNLAKDAKWIEKFTVTPRVLQGKEDGSASLGSWRRMWRDADAHTFCDEVLEDAVE